MPIIKEHQYLSDKKEEFSHFNPCERNEAYLDGLLLNPHAQERDRRYFFTWDDIRKSYVASYMIGVQRILGEELVIEPKIDTIDFMKMFSICLGSGIANNDFSKIYGINLDSKPIETSINFSASITPLLIVHFLQLVKDIVVKGLKYDYIQKNENIKKVKGKIDIPKHERKNVFLCKYDKVYCKYTERSVNIPENRLLKKTLLYCQQFIIRLKGNESFKALYQTVNYCLSYFENVDENIEIWEIRNTKTSSLYKNYVDAIKVAKSILRHFDYSINNIQKRKEKVPEFWIDMPLLYEHYVLGLLKRDYGNAIAYQKSGWFGWRPDFLHKKEQIIMDTKYMPQLEWNGLTGDIVGQLAGYSRVTSFTHTLGVDDETVIPCLILYPTTSAEAVNFHFDISRSLIEQANKASHMTKFYKLAVPLPKLKSK